MTSKSIATEEWTYSYDAENHLTEIRKDGVPENRYYYDGDGNRVARLRADNKGTIFISKYFEAAYPQIDIPEPPPPITEGCELGDEGCQGNLEGGNTPYAVPGLGKYGDSYYYAGSQRIAMRTGQGAYLLFSDHLGSTSIVMDASGQVVEEGYYMPWGGERGDQGIATTDYGYTGQMKEGDIYFYNSRWYDPSIGRFMQADTIVPMASQGTQAFDRYAYVNNNPLIYTDPSGNYFRECGDDHYERCGTIPPPPPTYNVFVCGVYDGNNCGETNPSTPLHPYYSWGGANAYFDVDQYGTKANTVNGILAYLGSLPNRSKLRFIGHSAGADTAILAARRLIEDGIGSHITGLILLDTSLSAAPDFMKTGSMQDVLGHIVEQGIYVYVAISDLYASTDPSIGYNLPPFLQSMWVDKANYKYHRAEGSSHYDIAVDYSIRDEAWDFINGGVR